MGFLDKLFGKKQDPATVAKNTADMERSRTLPKAEDIQTGEQQAASRTRMEAELDAQRAKREQGQTVQP